MTSAWRTFHAFERVRQRRQRKLGVRVPHTHTHTRVRQFSSFFLYFILRRRRKGGEKKKKRVEKRGVRHSYVIHVRFVNLYFAPADFATLLSLCVCV